jgi:hypothetical protein
MKKYHLAWVGLPQTGDVRLGSTDTDLIKWFLDEIKQIAPNYQYRADSLNKAFDRDGNQTYCEVYTLDGKDTQIEYWLLQTLLKMGWEPFAISERGQFASSKFIYMRREMIDG